MNAKARKNRKSRGQTIVEYVLIIAIVVVAAVGILSVFSDTVRQKIAGIVQVFGGDTSSASLDKKASDQMQELGKGTQVGSQN